MRNIILAAIAVIFGCNALAQPNWDKPMRLKHCTISIKADAFIATTFIEMEFYNSNSTVIEGLHRFELNPGQVITGFQLELNGKYREGSIEEKWKATNAYNTIVGKRIDPALLTMDYANNYSLRIYPVPAGGSRKVTMTIRQLLTNTGNQLIYALPLKIRDTLDFFSLDINVTGKERPWSRPGLVAGKEFAGGNDLHSLTWQTGQIPLMAPVSFAIPNPAYPFFCTKEIDSKNHFALRFRPEVEKEYPIHPKEIAVYWDASASAASRNINKEINFLEQYISRHKILRLTIIPFNYRAVDTAIFETGNVNSRKWQQYLRNIDYDGSTRLGIIDPDRLKADLVFLFTDGNNTYGRPIALTYRTPVYCINSSRESNNEMLTRIAGTGGGKVIDLYRTGLSVALSNSSFAGNWLLKFGSSTGKVIAEQLFPIKWSESYIINGIMESAVDTILFYYGNNAGINHVQKVPVNVQSSCPASFIQHISMLENFDKIIRSYSWNDMIDFGLKQKIVTPNTAYIVLERTEDYVRYNIAPPKELEEECEKLNYVRRDTRFDRNLHAARDQHEILSGVVNAYNRKLSIWDSREKPIVYNTNANARILKAKSSETIVVPQSSLVNALSGQLPGIQVTNNLEEVVVVGYGTSRKNNLTGAVAHIRSNDIFLQGTTVEQVLQGRVAGLQVTGSGMPGSTSNITIRGAASLSANTQPLYVVDGMPVSGNINEMVNLADVDHITVLKGVSATSIYGSRATNGAIIIATKKGKNLIGYYNEPYRLRDMEDMEYIEELKAVTVHDKMDMYNQLRPAYAKDAVFYFDVAQHIFESGLTNEAFAILMNAAEVSNGDQQVLLAIAYVLESWQLFKEALVVYDALVEANSTRLDYRRGMAWIHYQLCNYQEAVNLLYHAIGIDTKQQENLNQSIKALMLDEMNAIISVHKDSVDISSIPQELIKSLPVDLRIVIDGNKTNIANAIVREPGGATCSFYKSVSRNGGMLTGEFWHSKGPAEYRLKTAIPGKYRISVDYYDGYPYQIPSLIRITRFNNYGKPNQAIEIKTVLMNNQFGELEIAELKW